ncbi:hypothetical protein CMI39_03755 [Candidatus Pacearchaeota archaeon]|jgi:hypothetical protein|nr:hypothetical protein [Candidatus Pacearchaeota archaeon]|tara:strand:+ start:11331 stop:11909 length:579 start_codon:yes stop_codon:yes gene_type:complete
MIEEKIITKIYKIHLKQLKNLSVPHKKFMICFSGIAGSGKTYIAKILEKKYNGVRIRSDDIRGIIRSLHIDDMDNVTDDYLSWLFKNWPFKNKLIILDRGIDRKYKETFSIFKKKGYKIFIIRLKTPREIFEKRIKGKLGKLDQNYLNRINDWIKQWKEFGKKFKSDIIIKNEKDNKLELKKIFTMLDKLIK